jgi:diguanylate cyclase (GGDEF)-like protein/PAS domain S-box-containing protein
MSQGNSPDKLPCVLIADDDTAARLLVREALEQAGFSVVEAENGAQALSAFAEHNPEVVLLDVVMPEMDGFRACAEIRRLPGGANVPILMLTGLDDLESINKAYEAGATDFASKPINWLVLSHRVRYMLRMGRVFNEALTSKVRLSAAQRIARLGNWELDVGSGNWHWSDELYRLFGYEPNAVEPAQELLLARIHPEDRQSVQQTFANALCEQGFHDANYRILLPDGTIRYLYGQCETVLADDARATLRLAGTIQDISERKQAQDQIAFLENYDRLTSLPNRILFNDRLEYAIKLAKRQKHILALVVLGLDRFKRINDTLGHGVGDQLLQAVAQRILACIRETDAMTRGGPQPLDNMLARLGGDVFILLLPGINHVDNAVKISRRVLDVLSQAFHAGEQEVFITASIGISIYPDNGVDRETLLKNADAAMYHTKDAGGSNYQFYDKSMNAAALERLALENSLQKALERNELVLFYQPQVDIHTGAILGAEALIRWRHPELGMVAPDKFIPLAEETGLIVPIGEWVVRTACAQNQAWQASGYPPLRMAVNLSGRQFRQENLTELVESAIRSAGMDPRYLEVEITESIVMQNAEAAVNTLRALKGKGLHIALDDFGTGYSSLSYLKRFPIDVLKIDRSFIRDIATNPDDASITSAIIAMARSLDLDTVAEGVETEQQLVFLRQQGCRVVQGYYFSKPVPAGEFEVLLRDGFGGKKIAGNPG